MRCRTHSAFSGPVRAGLSAMWSKNIFRLFTLFTHTHMQDINTHTHTHSSSCGSVSSGVSSRDGKYKYFVTVLK